MCICRQHSLLSLLCSASLQCLKSKLAGEMQGDNQNWQQKGDVLCAGHILVRFYGERSLMWAKESELEKGCLTEKHIADLQTWSRNRQK